MDLFSQTFINNLHFEVLLVDNTLAHSISKYSELEIV